MRGHERDLPGSGEFPQLHEGVLAAGENVLWEE